MKTNTNLFFILLFVSNFGFSQQKKTESINFKNAIQYCILATNDKLIPLIDKSTYLLKKRKNDVELMNNYNECKLTIKLNKDLINKLNEIDKSINLKKKTLKYLDNADKILDNYILPIIKFLENPDNFNKNQILSTNSLVEKTETETAIINDLIKNFCDKHKLFRKMSEGEKQAQERKIEAFKKKI